MEKLAVYTICIGKEYRELGNYTLPRIEEYARKCGASFYVQSSPTVNDPWHGWEKSNVQKLFKMGYDRVLHVDVDVLIRKNSLNIFSMYPSDKLCLFDESEYIIEEYDIREESIKQVCKKYKLPLDSWNGIYYNNGIGVVPKQYGYLYSVASPIWKGSRWHEQDYLNGLIASEKIPVEILPYQLNHMHSLRVPSAQFESYFLHFAGLEHYMRIEKIKETILAWKTYGYE